MYLPMFLFALFLLLLGIGIPASRSVPVSSVVYFAITGCLPVLAAVRMKCFGEIRPPEAWNRAIAAVGQIEVRRLAVGLGAALLLWVVFLTIERVRGQRQLAAINRGLIEQKLPVSVRELYPAASPNYAAFTNRFESIAATLGEPAVPASSMIEVAPGRAARGSQATVPGTGAVLTNEHARITTPAGSWADLERQQAVHASLLPELRALLSAPPRARGLPSGDLTTNVWLGARAIRPIGRHLESATALALRRGDIEEAGRNLEALGGLFRVYESDPGLVTLMARAAVARIGAGAIWDALQTEGWTEPQWAAVQAVWQSGSLVDGLAKSLHGERLNRLELYRRFQGSSYREHFDRYLPLFESFGATQVVRDHLLVELWRHHIFHPVWSFAWANQEEAYYLRHSAGLSRMLRAALEPDNGGSSIPTAPERRAPALIPPWVKFYVELPLVDQMSPIGPAGPLLVARPALAQQLVAGLRRGSLPAIPDFSKAIRAARASETARVLAQTAIALQRFRLVQGHYPAALDELGPVLLGELPRDGWSHQPLHYRPTPDGRYFLYSNGENGRDDGGDPRSAAVTPAARMEDGLDMIWPAPIRWVE